MSVAAMPETGATMTGAPPSDRTPEALERKRERDKEAKRAARAAAKGASVPPAPASAPQAEAAPSKPVKPPRFKPKVRFRNGKAVPDEIVVDPINLETVFPGIAQGAAAMTGDGRFVLATMLEFPGTGRSLMANLGHCTDNVLAMHGIALSPEASVYMGVAVAGLVLASVVGKAPRMTPEQAMGAAPIVDPTGAQGFIDVKMIQAQLDATIGAMLGAVPTQKNSGGAH